MITLWARLLSKSREASYCVRGALARVRAHRLRLAGSAENVQQNLEVMSGAARQARAHARNAMQVEEDATKLYFEAMDSGTDPKTLAEMQEAVREAGELAAVAEAEATQAETILAEGVAQARSQGYSVNSALVIVGSPDSYIPVVDETLNALETVGEVVDTGTNAAAYVVDKTVQAGTLGVTKNLGSQVVAIEQNATEKGLNGVVISIEAVGKYVVEPGVNGIKKYLVDPVISTGEVIAEAPEKTLASTNQIVSQEANEEKTRELKFVSYSYIPEQKPVTQDKRTAVWEAAEGQANSTTPLPSVPNLAPGR